MAFGSGHGKSSDFGLGFGCSSRRGQGIGLSYGGCGCIGLGFISGLFGSHGKGKGTCLGFGYLTSIHHGFGFGLGSSRGTGFSSSRGVIGCLYELVNCIRLVGGGCGMCLGTGSSLGTLPGEGS